MRKYHQCPNCQNLQLPDQFQIVKSQPSGWCRSCRTAEAVLYRRKKGMKEKVSSVIVDGRKLCMECKSMLLLEEFSPTKRGLGGLATYCRSCMRIKYPVSKEDARKATADYRKRHRARYLAQHRVNMFKRRGQIEAESDGTVTDEFLKNLYAQKICSYCEQFVPEDKRTADHVTPLNKGGLHSAKNMVMSCFGCNSSKRDMSEEEFRKRIGK